MDLISRKELIEDITNDTVLENHIKDYIVNMINGMETAYDVEKVVEDIKKLRYPYTSFPEGYGELKAYDFYIDKSIDAARKGGLEE